MAQAPSLHVAPPSPPPPPPPAPTPAVAPAPAEATPNPAAAAAAAAGVPAAAATPAAAAAGGVAPVLTDGGCNHVKPEDWMNCQQCGDLLCMECLPPGGARSGVRLPALGIAVPMVVCAACRAALAAIDAVAAAGATAAAPPCSAHVAAPAAAAAACASCDAERAAAALAHLSAALALCRLVRFHGAGASTLHGGRAAAAGVLAVPLAGLSLVRGMLGGLAGGLVAGAVGGAVVGGAAGLDARNAAASAAGALATSASRASASLRRPAGGSSTALVTTPASAPTPTPRSDPSAPPAGGATPPPATPATPAAAPTDALSADAELRRIVAAKNAYDTLGVAPTASSADIRAAYRSRSRLYHPDRNSSSAAKDVSQALNNAYMLLSDDDKRRAYDASNFKDTSGVNLFDGIKVTADGVAVSVVGSLVGGTLGAGVGAVGGAAVGALSGATTTLWRVAASAYVQASADDTWEEALAAARLRCRRLPAARVAAAGGLTGVRASVTPDGEVAVEFTVPGAAGWRAGSRAARAAVGAALPALRHLVAPAAPAFTLASLLSATEMQVDADAVRQVLGALRARQTPAVTRSDGTPLQPAALPPAWVPAFVAALYAAARAMRADAGVVEDGAGGGDDDGDAAAVADACAAVWPALADAAAAGRLPPRDKPAAAAGGGAGLDYDDPRVATARALGVSVGDVAAKAPTSALGMLSWTNHLLSRTLDKARAAEELEVWNTLVATAATWASKPPLAPVPVSAVSSSSVPHAAAAAAAATAAGAAAAAAATAPTPPAAAPPPATPASEPDATPAPASTATSPASDPDGRDDDAAPPTVVSLDALLPPAAAPTITIALARSSVPLPAVTPAAPPPAPPSGGWRGMLAAWGGARPPPGSHAAAAAAGGGDTVWHTQEPLPVTASTDSFVLPRSVVAAALGDARADGGVEGGGNTTLMLRVAEGVTLAVLAGVPPSGATPPRGTVVSLTVAPRGHAAGRR